MDKLWMDSLRLEAVAINKDIDEPAFFGAWHLTGSKMGRAEKMIEAPYQLLREITSVRNRALE